jgi:hypothetical protein
MSEIVNCYKGCGTFFGRIKGQILKTVSHCGQFFGIKILKFFDADPDAESFFDPGSGMEIF